MDLPHLQFNLDTLREYEIPQGHLQFPSRFVIFPQRQSEYVEHVRSVLTACSSIESLLPAPLLEQIEWYLMRVFDLFKSSYQEAATLVRTSAPNAPNLESAIRSIEDKLVGGLKALEADQRAVELILFAGEVKHSSAPSEVEKRLAAFEGLIDQKIDSLKRREASLDRAIDTHQQEALTLAFSSRAGEHKRVEGRWRMLFVGAVVVFCGVLYWVLTSEPPILSESAGAGTDSRDSVVQLTVFSFRRLLAILSASFLVRFSLKRWNIERNLSIVYAHRVAALTQLELMTVNLPSDERSALRSEMGKGILADPVTGYLADGASEFSVSPVINNVLDRIPPRTS